MSDAPAEQATPSTDKATAPSPEPSTPDQGNPARLPDDHPLVTAFEAQKAKNADLATKLKEFEDAQLSDAERLNNDLASATERANAAEAELNRLRIAVKHGIADDDLDLLGTGSADEIEARAKRISALRGQQAEQETRRPVGSLGSQTEPPADPDSWLRSLANG